MILLPIHPAKPPMMIQPMMPYVSIPADPFETGPTPNR
jgi:hypothetical protein